MVMLEGRLISGSALWMVIPLGKLRPGMGSFLQRDQSPYLITRFSKRQIEMNSYEGCHLELERLDTDEMTMPELL
jgi:hypothetical protein